MRLTVLGSGTLLPDDDHRSPAHLLEDRGCRCLLDCGAGTLHGFHRHGVEWEALDHVVLTHFHTDHVGDLPALLWALRHGARHRRAHPLRILGPRGLRRFMEALAAAHGGWVLEPPFPLEIQELEPKGEWIAEDGSIRLRTAPTPHTDESIAVRWDGGGATVAYTGDTGPSSTLAPFLEGAEVLVAECALTDDAEPDNHLTPRTVGDLATAVDPEVLVLTHLYPGVPRAGLPDLVAERGYSGRAVVGRDGLVVEGRAGSLQVRDPSGGFEDR